MKELSYIRLIDEQQLASDLASVSPELRATMELGRGTPTSRPPPTLLCIECSRFPVAPASEHSGASAEATAEEPSTPAFGTHMQWKEARAIELRAFSLIEGSTSRAARVALTASWAALSRTKVADIVPRAAAKYQTKAEISKRSGQRRKTPWCCLR